MTVDTTISRTQTDGDGIKTNFLYNFKIDKAEDLSVYFTDKTTAVMTLLVEGVDYDVNNVGAATGSIDMLATGANPVPRDWTADKVKATEDILCIRQPDLLQSKVFKTQGDYRAKEVEYGLDFVMMCVQMVKEGLDRCLKVQESSGVDPSTLTYETFAGSAPVSTTNFNGILSATEDTIQKALDVLDDDAAPLASPTLTGTPTAPTAAIGTDSTQLATTAYVDRVSGARLIDSVVESGSQIYLTLGAIGTPIPADWDSLVVEIRGINPSGTGVDFLMQVGGDGSWKTASNYDFINVGHRISGASPVPFTYGGENDPEAVIASDVRDEPTKRLNARIRFNRSGATAGGNMVIHWDGEVHFVDDTNLDLNIIRFAGWFDAETSDDLSAVRFYFSSGTIDGGHEGFMWALPRGI